MDKDTMIMVGLMAVLLCVGGWVAINLILDEPNTQESVTIPENQTANSTNSFKGLILNSSHIVNSTKV